MAEQVKQVSYKVRLKDVTFTRGSKPMSNLLWCDKVPKAKHNKPAKLNGVLLSDVQVFHQLWCCDTWASVHYPLRTASSCAILHMSVREAKSNTTSSHLTNRPLPLPNRLFTCYHWFMTDTAPNRSALITALYNEYKFLCHDDFDPEVDPTPDEYLLMLQHLSDDELIFEASADDINEFLTNWQ